MFETPVLLLVFNRPDLTKKVLSVLAELRPKYLFVAADGPRSAIHNESLLCDEVRDLILNGIKWKCDVKTLFQEQNLGCGKAVSNAITWFFTQVEEGIILEDDCLPDLSFFSFCQVLLERYRNVEKVMHIGGNNFLFGKVSTAGDYYFSALAHIWGWATWKRAWIKYEFELKNNRQIDDASYSLAFRKGEEFVSYFKHIFNEVAHHRIDTWDYQWLYTLILHKGVAICPRINLVCNLGFREDASHTQIEPDWNKRNSAYYLSTFLPPNNQGINHKADEFVLRNIFGIQRAKKQGKILKYFNVAFGKMNNHTRKILQAVHVRF